MQTADIAGGSSGKAILCQLRGEAVKPSADGLRVFACVKSLPVERGKVAIYSLCETAKSCPVIFSSQIHLEKH